MDTVRKIKTAHTILCLFDYKANTGFGTISKNIVANLKQFFGNKLILHIYAINYFGEHVTFEDTEIVSAKLTDPAKDDFGRYGFLKQIDAFDYDGIFIMQDIGVVQPIIEILKTVREKKKNENRPNFKSMLYFPVDCKMPGMLMGGIEFFDTIITYTKFGKEDILRINPKLKGRINIVPHGVNTADFYPQKDAEKIKLFRKLYFGLTEDRFIVTNVNRNQPRKDIPNTIFGFIEAKQTWPDHLPKPFLYLHMNSDDPLGWKLKQILDQTDLKEGVDYMLTPKDVENHDTSIENLNMIYNASDVYISTTVGEGWGCPVHEAMATKTPVICTNYSSLPEMCGYGDRAFMLETLYPCCNQVDSIIRFQTDLYEVAEKIKYVAENREEALEKAELAYKWAVSLDWSIVSKLWVDHFKNTYGLK